MLDCLKLPALVTFYTYSSAHLESRIESLLIFYPLTILFRLNNSGDSDSDSEEEGQPPVCVEHTNRMLPCRRRPSTKKEPFIHLFVCRVCVSVFFRQ